MFFHGTGSAEAARILAGGFDLEAPRRSDPGDFGWGAYLTDQSSRARAYGEQVLRVEVGLRRFARIANPYFLDGLREVEPATPEERLFHGTAFRDGAMVSVKADPGERAAVARRIGEAFKEAGYDGILAGPDGRGQREAVVFNLGSIVRVAWYGRI